MTESMERNLSENFLPDQYWEKGDEQEKIFLLSLFGFTGEDINKIKSLAKKCKKSEESIAKSLLGIISSDRKDVLGELLAIILSKPYNKVATRTVFEESLRILGRFSSSKGEERMLLLTEFEILLEKFASVFSQDHDFAEAQKIMTRLTELKEQLEDIPLYFEEPFLFNSLQLARETGNNEQAETTALEVLSNLGSISMPHGKKLEFFVQLIKFLPPEQTRTELKSILDTHRGVGEIDKNLQDFFESHEDEVVKKKQEEYVMRAFREWLKLHPDKNSEDYKKDRDDFIRKACGYDKEGQSWVADVLRTEGFELGDYDAVSRSIEIYRSTGKDFRVAETELKIILTFKGKIPPEKRKELFFKNWRFIEEKCGRRVIEVFLDNLQSPVESTMDKVKQRAIGTTNQDLEQKILFRRIPNVPSYINDIAEVIVEIYDPEGKDILKAFRKALKQYFYQYEAEKVTKLNRAVAELDSSDDILEEIKNIFELVEVEILTGEGVMQNNLAQQALNKNGKIRREYVIAESHKFLREEIAIPVNGTEDEKAVLVIKNENKKQISPEELRLIVSALGGDESIIDLEINDLLVPKKFEIKVVKDSEISSDDLNVIQELYVLGLGLEMPKRQEDGEEKKIWGLVYTEDGDLVGAGYISPTTISSSPFIYAGYPENKDQIEKGLGIKLEECAVTGGLAIYPYLKRQVLPLLLKTCGQITQIEGYQRNLMVVHGAVIRILNELIGKEKIRTIPTYLSSKDEEEIKRRLKEVYGWDERFVAECVRIYANQNSASIIVDSESLSDILITTLK